MPHFSFIGPLEKPFKVRSTMNALRPDGSRCFFFSRSVQAMTRKLSATSASEIHDLLAVEDVAIAPLHRSRLDGARVAAGAGFGQAVAGDLRALRLRHEIALLLILAAPRQQRQAVQPGVHRHDHAQRGVDVFEFLAGQPQADVIHAGAAVLLRHRDAEQAEPGHAAEDAIAIEAVLAIGLADVRRNFPRAPIRGPTAPAAAVRR